MDRTDLDHLQAAFPEQPGPSKQLTAQTRSKLEALAREEATAEAGSAAPSRPATAWAAASLPAAAGARTWRRSPPRPAGGVREGWAWWVGAFRSGQVGIGLTGAVAALVVATLAVPMVLGPRGGEGPAGTPSTGTPVPRLVTASQVLLELAIKQERDERGSGEYFRVRTLRIRTINAVGTPGSTYQLEQRRIAESWMPMRPGARSLLGWADLGSRPATAADWTRWREQGAPRSWQLPDEDDPVTMAPSKPVLNKMSLDEVPPGYFLNGDKPVSARDIQALPADPVVLRRVLSASAQPGATQEEIDFTVFCAAGRLLFEMPSPPKLRGAALRVMSELPGAVLRENVHDPIGRVGTEITHSWNFKRSQPTARPTVAAGIGMRYIVDTTTGRLLSSEATGTKKGASVVLESAWTDEAPRPPSTAIR